MRRKRRKKNRLRARVKRRMSRLGRAQMIRYRRRRP